MGANFNFNKAIIGGRITSDIELKQTQDGTPVCSFSVAVARKGSKDGKSDFINCVAWRHNAEFISRYFGKGSAICITGSIQTRSWEDQNKQKRYATEVVVEEACFVDSKGEGNGNQTSGQPSFANMEAVTFEEGEGDTLPF